MVTDNLKWLSDLAISVAMLPEICAPGSTEHNLLDSATKGIRYDIEEIVRRLEAERNK